MDILQGITGIRPVFHSNTKAGHIPRQLSTDSMDFLQTGFLPDASCQVSKPEDQWSCKRSPEICCIDFSNIQWQLTQQSRAESGSN